MMLKPVYWTLVDSLQTQEDTQRVLSPSELEKFSTFHFPKRREDWLLGRWTAKALAHSLPTFRHTSLDKIEIHNDPEGAPYLKLSGKNTPEHCLTISHSEQFSLCALALGPNLRVGADLEKIEARTETFILDYFTAGERKLVDLYPAETRAILVTLIWSTKESMLKALRVGLRWDTRTVEVRHVDGLLHGGANGGKWQKIQVGERQANSRTWVAWWQLRDPFILTLAGYAATQTEIESVYLVEKRIY
jgi:4'-phosphopantetheinyl transferase